MIDNRLLIGASAIILTLALTACGGGGSGTSASSDGSSGANGGSGGSGSGQPATADTFTNQAATMAASSPDNTEPVAVDSIAVTTPDNTQPMPIT